VFSVLMWKPSSGSIPPTAFGCLRFPRPLSFLMPRSGHIALAGAPNAGKSSLLNALVGQHLAIVSPKAQATRLPVVGIRTDDQAQFIFHDLPGLFDPGYLLQFRMRDAALDALQRMDLVLHLHPAPEAPAPLFSTLTGADHPGDAPVLTVYTKGDLVSPRKREELGSTGTVVSAIQGTGLDLLLERILPHLPEREPEFDTEDVSTQTLRFFVVEYLREAAFQYLGDELPYAFTAEVEEFREAERPVYIRVVLFVERESQKGMVIGQGGRTIKAIGAHARARMEALVGLPVYLDCWVKVLPNWRKSAAALSRFGFPEPTQKTRSRESHRKENA
jgi:GTP-binding protein Era